jgi:hypothetical protein
MGSEGEFPRWNFRLLVSLAWPGWFVAMNTSAGQG